jgi:hypothetical protein
LKGGSSRVRKRKSRMAEGIDWFGGSVNSPCSQLNVGPSCWMFLKGIIVSWVRELSIMVFDVQISLCGFGNSEEVGDVLLVGEVLVEVVLEVLKFIHMVLNQLVSSNSWE